MKPIQFLDFLVILKLFSKFVIGVKIVKNLEEEESGIGFGLEWKYESIQLDQFLCLNWAWALDKRFGNSLSFSFICNLFRLDISFSFRGIPDLGNDIFVIEQINLTYVTCLS